MIDHNPLTHQFYLKEIERQAARSAFPATQRHSAQHGMKQAVGKFALFATLALLAFTGHMFA